MVDLYIFFLFKRRLQSGDGNEKKYHVDVTVKVFLFYLCDAVFVIIIIIVIPPSISEKHENQLN